MKSVFVLANHHFLIVGGKGGGDLMSGHIFVHNKS